MDTNPPNAPLNLENLRERLLRLGLHGLLANVESISHEPWLPQLLQIEEAERSRRSLRRRLKATRLQKYNPMADFDWSWPTQCDRPLVEELFSLNFIEEPANIVLIGPNGIGKTMLAKNLLHQAVLHGHTARFTLASDMLHDLAAQDSSVSLARRLRRYTSPTVLGIDEVGYLSYDSRYADLFFEVITRRYQKKPRHYHHQQTVRRVDQSLPQCRLRRHPRRSAHAQGRTLESRGKKLSLQRGARTHRSQCQIPCSEKNEKALRDTAMEPNNLPIVCIPLELPAEAAAELLQFLNHLTETIERHYFGELHRLAQQRSAQNRDPDYSPFARPESDPPF
jgi:DNA replication protein DnaC